MGRLAGTPSSVYEGSSFALICNNVFTIQVKGGLFRAFAMLTSTAMCVCVHIYHILRILNWAMSKWASSGALSVDNHTETRGRLYPAWGSTTSSVCASGSSVAMKELMNKIK